MHIVIASQDFPPDIGGTQTYAVELAKRWARSEKVTVVAPWVDGADNLDAGLQATIRRVPGGHNSFALRAAPTLKALRSEADVVFCVQWTAALACLLAGWTSRRIVLAAHGRELLFNPFSGPLGALYSSVRSRVFRRVRAVAPVSRFTSSLAEGLGVEPSRIQVVTNGTDPDRFRPVASASVRDSLAPSEALLLMTVCRLVPRKGVDIILQALPAVLDRHPDTILAVVGDGPERGRLEQMARTQGVEHAVRFTGSVSYDELPAYFSAADLFVMTPRTLTPDVEGFGLVYLEANACGTPVIGSSSGGIPDAIQDNVTGLLIRPDSHSDLSEAINKLLTDDNTRSEMARAGRAFAEGPGSWERSSLELLDLLRSAAST